LKQQIESKIVQNEVLHPDRVGHLVPVCCGHTGHQSTEEAYLMEMHLKLAGFIEKKEQSNNPSKMDVSQPDAVAPEFNSTSSKIPENIKLPPIGIKLNIS
jgi:hypothetical protein